MYLDNAQRRVQTQIKFHSASYLFFIVFVGFFLSFSLSLFNHHHSVDYVQVYY